MNKQKKSTATLVAKLNRQYRAYERFGKGRNLNEMADQSLDEFFSQSKKLGDAFDATLTELKSLGVIVKFDSKNGEYYVGKNKYRIQLTVDRSCVVEVEAPTVQIAMIKAKALAKNDISNVEENIRFENLSDEV